MRMHTHSVLFIDRVFFPMRLFVQCPPRSLEHLFFWWRVSNLTGRKITNFLTNVAQR